MDNFFNLYEPRYNIPQPNNKYISNSLLNLSSSSISDITKLFDINNLEEILNSTQDNVAVCVIGKAKVETEGFKITKVLEKELYKDIKCYSENNK